MVELNTLISIWFCYQFIMYTGSVIAIGFLTQYALISCDHSSTNISLLLAAVFIGCNAQHSRLSPSQWAVQLYHSSKQGCCDPIFVCILVHNYNYFCMNDCLTIEFFNQKFILTNFSWKRDFSMYTFISSVWENLAPCYSHWLLSTFGQNHEQ